MMSDMYCVTSLLNLLTFSLKLFIFQIIVLFYNNNNNNFHFYILLLLYPILIRNYFIKKYTLKLLKPMPPLQPLKLSFLPRLLPVFFQNRVPEVAPYMAWKTEQISIFWEFALRENNINIQ